MREVVIVGHLCGFYRRKSDSIKVDVIGRMKEDCGFLTEVRRFLGVCVFYRIWISHFAYIADSLYELLRKGYRFEWKERYIQAMQRLKKLLMSSSILRKVDYKCNRPVIFTVDVSPIAVGWAVG
ncbi:hypothetical protein GCM10010252_77780 [Streptomyces aureoverticillatus]|nr:hypothetical protein GCM10010252_77780 [Streptomyces aureoverticillatus]